jgi:acetylornithine/succinyldiaminopimelate/putrescine aminotransferase
MEGADFLERHLAATTPHPLGDRVVGAQGSWIELNGSERLFDMVSGVGTSSLGHGHPAILEAIHGQVDAHLHVMVYGEFAQAPQDRAAALLCSMLPAPLDTVYFVNSGTEAIEGAIKLARRVGAAEGRTKCIALQGAYHGGTTGALALAGKSARRDVFQPLLPDVEHVPLEDLSALTAIDEKTAAVFAETIQGDAGIRPLSSAYLKALRKRCDETGALLVLDEIQCGLGRTGRLHAFERAGIVPDVLCLGKALGGGMPIGALVARRGLMEQLSFAPKLGHITTFGGHPVTCAAAAAFLGALKSEVDLPRVERIGADWLARLSAHHAVREVRGQGLFLGVDLESAEHVNLLVAEARKRGLLLFWFLSRPTGFRLAPPLNASDAELESAFLKLLAALDVVT